MTENRNAGNRGGLNTTSKMSFAVAGCAFIAALVGLLINHWLSGWMAVGGMTGVGLFYLAIGLLNLEPAETGTQDEQKFAETAAHRLSGIGNVDDRAVVRPVVKMAEEQHERVSNAKR